MKKENLIFSQAFQLIQMHRCYIIFVGYDYIYLKMCIDLFFFWFNFIRLIIFNNLQAASFTLKIIIF